MARKKAFKAESKRLMDLMINSIYTHKEIFLRELISNASDAIDKLYYKALQENLQDINRQDLQIDIELDKDNRQIIIRDNGIGMDKEELEANLGTIAKSGSYQFKEELSEEDKKEDIDVIGQFGVGFYSAFMVADKVEVLSKKYGSEEAYQWVSEDVDGYTISPCDKEEHGTTIILSLREDKEEEDYSTYLETYTIERLVKKYSDYVRYPIKMDVEESKRIEGEDEPTYETVVENKTLNSMVPLWKRNKSEISEEEYNEFYKSKFNDYSDPLKTIHMHIEGNVNFDALLFIPSKTPMNYYTQDFKKGLQLYSRGVYIKDNTDELIPDHFKFVKGLVDSQDLSLNISREMLQHDRQLKVIANRIEKKIKSELLLLLRNDRENYESFWNNFGLQIKFGVYNDFGAHKDLLQDLLLFYSNKEEKLVTLDEYVNRMDENQKYIYFMSGESIDKIDKNPQMEALKEKGYEVLYLYDDVDEFCLSIMESYKDTPFKNVSQGDLELESEEEKQELEATKELHKDLLEAIKDSLSEVSEVKITKKLKSHAVCLSAGEGMSFEMEKVFSHMPEGNPMGMKATRILEINPDHPIFDALVKMYNKDKDSIKDYASLLYNQALLLEGFEIDDVTAFTNQICDLMVKANQ